MPGFWADYPGIYANVLPQRRKPYITKVNIRENDAGFKWILGAERVPGGNAIKVQLWWAVQATIFACRHKYCIAGGHFYYVYSAQKWKKRSYSSVSKNYLSVEINLGDYAWVGDDVNLYTLGEITMAHIR